MLPVAFLALSGAGLKAQVAHYPGFQ